ncbi:MAG: hypothetical protein JO304_11340 [Solirubrobacterales bacterium]|nr:hypothetical protein [Solirubrobacterales bacterium]
MGRTVMSTGDARNHAAPRGDLAGELERPGTGRTIDACRRAGLLVAHEDDCTCSLDGRLVVLASPHGLRVLWPYDRQCPVHDPRDRQAPRPAAGPDAGRPHSPAGRLVWVKRQAGIR